MATRTAGPYTWSPEWGQGEEGPWTETGLERDIRGPAPCQALRAKRAKNRSDYFLEEGGVFSDAHPPTGHH